MWLEDAKLVLMDVVIVQVLLYVLDVILDMSFQMEYVFSNVPQHYLTIMELPVLEAALMEPTSWVTKLLAERAQLSVQLAH